MIGRAGSRGHHVAPQPEAPIRLDHKAPRIRRCKPRRQNLTKIAEQLKARRRKAAISLLRLAKS
jgi:hypothetical protein